MKKQVMACKNCGKERMVQGWQTKQPTFTGLCIDCSRRQTRENTGRCWKGGITHTAQGYVEVRLYPDNPYYPMAAKRWHYCREHRYIMAQHLGRCLLPYEVVHHKNGDRADNRIENLELESLASHISKTKFCKNCTLRKEVRLLHSKIGELEEQIKFRNLKEWGINGDNKGDK